MSTEFADFEAGSNGSNLVASTGGCPYDVVDHGTGTGTAIFDNSYAHQGSLSAKFTTATGAGNFSIARHTLGANATAHFRRIYFRPNSLPSGTQALLTFKDSTGSLCCQVCLNTNGSYKLQNSSSAIIQSSTAVVGSGNPVRIELGVSAAVPTFKLFYGANIEGTSADETKNDGVNLTQPTIRRIQIGGDLAVTFSGNFDDDAWDPSAFVGPKAAPPPSGGVFTWSHLVTIG